MTHEEEVSSDWTIWLSDVAHIQATYGFEVDHMDPVHRQAFNEGLSPSTHAAELRFLTDDHRLMFTP